MFIFIIYVSTLFVKDIFVSSAFPAFPVLSGHVRSLAVWDRRGVCFGLLYFTPHTILYRLFRLYFIFLLTAGSIAEDRGVVLGHDVCEKGYLRQGGGYGRMWQK